jgi:hypothetical protein
MWNRHAQDSEHWETLVLPVLYLLGSIMKTYGEEEVYLHFPNQALNGQLPPAALTPSPVSTHKHKKEPPIHIKW